MVLLLWCINIPVIIRGITIAGTVRCGYLDLQLKKNHIAMEFKCFIFDEDTKDYLPSIGFASYIGGLYREKGYFDSRTVLSSFRSPDVGERYIVDHVILWAGTIEYYLKLKE